MNFSKILNLLYISLVAALVIFSVLLIIHATQTYDWHDFEVFYSAARAAIEGRTIYIIVGQYNLPFWYFPWVAWFYIPFSFSTYTFGLALYQLASLISMFYILISLSRHYDPKFNPLHILLFFAMSVLMSIQLMQVGQMDYILLALIVTAIFAIDKKRDILTGILLPFIWIKPHLVIVFSIFAVLLSGKRTVITTAGLIVLMLLIQTMLYPGWHLEMLELLKVGSQRIDGLQFTTFPSLLGFQENWVGTGNLPFTVALIVFALASTWYFRSLPTIPFLSFALTASLFCAPRAYAYDLPLLIPSMIWLTVNDLKRNIWIWIAIPLIALASVYGTTSYLAVLLVYGLSLWRAYQTTRLSSPTSEIKEIS